MSSYAQLKPQSSPESVDAYGSPAIESFCRICGEGFIEKDLTELEWPVYDHPAHRSCFLEFLEGQESWLEEMRGA